VEIELIHGYCPICEIDTMFEVHGPWSRDQLICSICHSIPRERALCFALNRISPEYTEKVIHESSPTDRGISKKLRETCSNYLNSQFFANSKEKLVGNFYNINLENQDFPDDMFDIFISLDVLEHVFDPQKAIAEIYRTLKAGGVAIMTFPIIKSQVDAFTPRAVLSDGVVQYLAEPEYHGNPIDENGSLVTVDYGYDIHIKIAEWSEFNVEIIRYCRRDIAVIGEFTEVIVLYK
jgi:SAM-dependent methyltransferase